MKGKQYRNTNRQNFLLTFFESNLEYEEKIVNGFVLVKHRNGNTGGYEVAIYPPESFTGYSRLKGETEELRRQNQEVREIAQGSILDRIRNI